MAKKMNSKRLKHPTLKEDSLIKVDLIEEKLKKCTDMMREALSRKDFKDFYQVRISYLTLFKETLPLSIRKKFWPIFIKLTQEAEKLRETSFSCDEIVLAISHLQEELSQIEKTAPPGSFFPDEISLSLDQIKQYSTIQNRIQLYNKGIASIQTLQEEIIKIDLQIFNKEHFLISLSHLKKGILSKRKKAIEEISTLFSQDVNQFFESLSNQISLPPHLLRERIKQFQNLSAYLTLQSELFISTRKKLSELWNRVRKPQKKRKNIEKTLPAKEHLKEEKGKIEHLKKHAKKYSSNKSFKQESNKTVKEEKQKTKKVSSASPILQKEKKVERNEPSDILKKEISSLLDQIDLLSFEEMSQKKEKIFEIVENLKLSHPEDQFIDHIFAPIDAIWQDKQINRNFDTDQKQSIETLQTLLNVKQNQKREFKNKLETCRHCVGGTGMDFESALLFRDLFEMTKNHYRKIDEEIRTIQNKIEKLTK